MQAIGNVWQCSDLAFGLHYQPSLNDSSVSLKCIGQLNKFTSAFLSLHVTGDARMRLYLFFENAMQSFACLGNQMIT